MFRLGPLSRNVFGCGTTNFARELRAHLPSRLFVKNLVIVLAEWVAQPLPFMA